MVTPKMGICFMRVFEAFVLSFWSGIVAPSQASYLRSGSLRVRFDVFAVPRNVLFWPGICRSSNSGVTASMGKCFGFILILRSLSGIYFSSLLLPVGWPPCLVHYCSSFIYVKFPRDQSVSGVCVVHSPCGFALLDLGVVNNACYTVPSCICLHPAMMRLGVFDL